MKLKNTISLYPTPYPLPITGVPSVNVVVPVPWQELRATGDGRRLHRTLHQFLHDGRRLRTELVETIVSRLERLHNTLANQETFRFYSSSLLIVYEGEAPKALAAPVDLKNYIQ